MSFDRAELLGRLAGVSAPGKSAFPSHPRWKFVFVSHLTTSPLFVPLQYGIQDACALVACGYSWTGSPTGDPNTVAKAVNSAVAAKADGIALPLLDPTLLDDPIDAALRAGIPVVAYQVMASGGKRRIAFVGQDAQAAGSKIGKRIARLVRRGRVSLFASDPSEAGLHLRARSALTAIRRSGLPVEADLVATTHDPYGASARVDKYVLDHPGVRGLFALEPVASEAIQRAMDKHSLRAKGVRAGGYGVFPETLDKITDSELDYTIDEQPYLQGFVPVLQLFLAKLSGGLLAPCDTTLALRFVTKANLTPYLAKTRYEGSSSKQRYPIR